MASSLEYFVVVTAFVVRNQSPLIVFLDLVHLIHVVPLKKLFFYIYYNNCLISSIEPLTHTKISKFCTSRATFFQLNCSKSATLVGFSIVSEVLVRKYRGNFSLSENCGDDVLYPI